MIGSAKTKKEGQEMLLQNSCLITMCWTRAKSQWSSGPGLAMLGPCPIIGGKRGIRGQPAAHPIPESHPCPVPAIVVASRTAKGQWGKGGRALWACEGSDPQGLS